MVTWWVICLRGSPISCLLTVTAGILVLWSILQFGLNLKDLGQERMLTKVPFDLGHPYLGFSRMQPNNIQVAPRKLQARR
jgi:hypothetical protein